MKKYLLILALFSLILFYNVSICISAPQDTQTTSAQGITSQGIEQTGFDSEKGIATFKVIEGEKGSLKIGDQNFFNIREGVFEVDVNSNEDKLVYAKFKTEGIEEKGLFKTKSEQETYNIADKTFKISKDTEIEYFSKGYKTEDKREYQTDTFKISGEKGTKFDIKDIKGTKDLYKQVEILDGESVYVGEKVVQGASMTATGTYISGTGFNVKDELGRSIKISSPEEKQIDILMAPKLGEGYYFEKGNAEIEFERYKIKGNFNEPIQLTSAEDDTIRKTYNFFLKEKDGSCSIDAHSFFEIELPKGEEVEKINIITGENNNANLRVINGENSLKFSKDGLLVEDVGEKIASNSVLKFGEQKITFTKERFHPVKGFITTISKGVIDMGGYKEEAEYLSETDKPKNTLDLVDSLFVYADSSKQPEQLKENPYGQYLRIIEGKGDSESLESYDLLYKSSKNQNNEAIKSAAEGYLNAIPQEIKEEYGKKLAYGDIDQQLKDSFSLIDTGEYDKAETNLKNVLDNGFLISTQKFATYSGLGRINYKKANQKINEKDYSAAASLLESSLSYYESLAQVDKRYLKTVSLIQEDLEVVQKAQKGGWSGFWAKRLLTD